MSIESVEEQDRIVSYIASSGNAGFYYWTSGNDIQTEGQYKWQSTGRDMYYKNFVTPEVGSCGEAVVDPLADCVIMKGDTENGYKWDSVLCTGTYWFICEVTK